MKNGVRKCSSVMSTSSFLVVNDQSVSLLQAFQYLQSSGKLDDFISAILRQYVVQQELDRHNFEVSAIAVEQTVTDFRLQHQLITPEEFQNWLAEHNIDQDYFYQRARQDLQLSQLREQVTLSRIQEYFIERKLHLDQVVLSRIAVKDQDMADELMQHLQEGARLEDLAREYSLTEDRLFNGMMGLVSRGALPDHLRAALELVQPGTLIGPLEVDGLWQIFRLEHLLPATLDDVQIQQRLRDELFDQWILSQLQQMAIEVRVDD